MAILVFACIVCAIVICFWVFFHYSNERFEDINGRKKMIDFDFMKLKDYLKDLKLFGVERDKR